MVILYFRLATTESTPTLQQANINLLWTTFNYKNDYIQLQNRT